MISRDKIIRLFKLPFFPVIAAPFVLYFVPLLTGRTLFWGLPVLQFIPWQAYAWQQLSQGMLPLWNPLNGMGAPLMANYQLALFYPPTWLAYLFAAVGGTPAMAWAQTLLVPLHLAWAGIGMALLARRLGLNDMAQAVSGLALGMGGYFVARSGFYSMIWAGAWLPWILWAVSSFARPVYGQQISRRFIQPGLAAWFALQLLAGHAQLSWYTLTLAGVWAVVGGWVDGKWRGSLKAVGILAINALLGAALAAVQLLPTAEYLLQSQRSGAVDFDLGLTYSFWPWRFLTFLAPNLFGNPGSGDYWGYASFWEDAVYLGILPLVMALSTLIYFGRKGNTDPYRPLFLTAWGVIGVGALFGLGKNTPLFPFLYHTVPTFSLFNGPARWMIWVVFSLSLLAGIGSARWTRPAGKARRRLKQMTAAAAAITLGAVIGWIVMRDVQVTFIAATALMGVWITGVCLLTLNMPQVGGGPAYRRWQAGVILWLILDLLAAGWYLGPTLPASYFSDSSQVSNISATPGRVYLNGQDEYALKFKRFFRFSDYSPMEDWTHLRQMGLPDMNLLPGSQFWMVNNFDPIVPGRFSRWMDWVDHLPSAQQEKALELMNVSLELKRDVFSESGIALQPVKGLDRFRWMTCPQWAAGADEAWSAVKQVISSAIRDPAQLLVVEGIGANTSSSCLGNSSAQIAVSTGQPEKIVVQVSTDQEGYLYIADTWYPGWNATVDGMPVDILRANYLFQVVPVKAGVHTVELRYMPVSIMVGAVISFVAILFLFLSSITHRHRVK